MAVNKVTICNRALAEIGGPPISALDQSTGEGAEAARICNRIFDNLLDEELMAENWLFATHRKQLAALSAAPDFGYTYQHQLPSDPYCLKVIKEINDYEYKMEGRVLLCDSTPMQIIYIKRITVMSDLSALFRAALQYKIASILAVPLIGSRNLKKEMNSEYTVAILKASARDAQQETADELPDGSWTDARGGA